MSCKYLCQVGALANASTSTDRCEFPVGARMIERFWGSGLLPLPLSPGPATSTVPGHCPPLLPLRDPVIESVEHGVYFGRTSERSRWRERGSDRRGQKETDERQRKRGAGRHSTDLSILTSQRATITVASVLIYASMLLLKNTFKTAGKWPKTYTGIIWYNGIQTQCWFVGLYESALFIHCCKQHLKGVIWSVRADKY